MKWWVCAFPLALILAGVSMVFPAAADTAFVISAPQELVNAEVAFSATVPLNGNPGFCAAPAAESAVDRVAADFTALASPTDAGAKETTTENPSVPAAGVFPDVADHWAKAYTARAAELGLFKGYDDGLFHPDAAMSRSQFVTVLYRMSGSPDATEEAPFVDTGAENSEFRKAIAWAYKNGFINGRTETMFDPWSGVTRQEAIKILFGLSGGVSGPEALLTAVYDAGFADSAEIAPWAKNAMYWAYYREIISGDTAATLAPERVATRAEIAKILVNYIEEYGR